MEYGAVIESATKQRAFEIDGERFVLSDLFPAGGADAFSIIKPPGSIRDYIELLERFERPTIVEIGVAYGGSTAFLALTADAHQLIAFEISPERLERLDDLIERKGLADRVHVHHGVDQADVGRLAATLDGHIGPDGMIDLVIDDASHQYDPTMATFNALFPRLREGGLYVIEDWTCDHKAAQLIVDAANDDTRPEHPWALNMLNGESGVAGDGGRPLASVAAEALGAPPWKPGERPELMSKIAGHLQRCVAESDPSIASVLMTSEWIVVTKGSQGDRLDMDLATACTDGALSSLGSSQ